MLWQFHGNVFHGSCQPPAPASQVGGWWPSRGTATQPKSCHYYASESCELACHVHSAPIPETSVFLIFLLHNLKDKREHDAPKEKVM